MTLSSLPVRLPSAEPAVARPVDLTAAETAAPPAALDVVLGWLTSLEA